MTKRKRKKFDFGPTARDRLVRRQRQPLKNLAKVEANQDEEIVRNLDLVLIPQVTLDEFAADFTSEDATVTDIETGEETPIIDAIVEKAHLYAGKRYKNMIVAGDGEE